MVARISGGIGFEFLLKIKLQRCFQMFQEINMHVVCQYIWSMGQEFGGVNDIVMNSRICKDRKVSILKFQGLLNYTVLV